MVEPADSDLSLQYHNSGKGKSDQPSGASQLSLGIKTREQSRRPRAAT